MPNRSPREERRAMALTPADIEAIAKAVHQLQKDDPVHATCRFGNADPNTVREALEFYTSFNNAVQDSKKTVRRWLIVAFMTAILALLGQGLLTRIKGG